MDLNDFYKPNDDKIVSRLLNRSSYDMDVMRPMTSILGPSGQIQRLVTSSALGIDEQPTIENLFLRQEEATITARASVDDFNRSIAMDIAGAPATLGQIYHSRENVLDLTIDLSQYDRVNLTVIADPNCSIEENRTLYPVFDSLELRTVSENGVVEPAMANPTTYHREGRNFIISKDGHSERGNIDIIRR